MDESVGVEESLEEPDESVGAVVSIEDEGSEGVDESVGVEESPEELEESVGAEGSVGGVVFVDDEGGVCACIKLCAKAF